MRQHGISHVTADEGDHVDALISNDSVGGASHTHNCDSKLVTPHFFQLLDALRHFYKNFTSFVSQSLDIVIKAPRQPYPHFVISNSRERKRNRPETDLLPFLDR